VNAVEVRGLSKKYPLSDSGLSRLGTLFAPANPRFGEVVWALRDVSFSVEKGEAFGIIGPNGSGKSTLLQIIAGILRPTRGTVEVGGRLSALLELGSGFSPEFTGRDNVYLNASLLGLSRPEVDARFAAIERFAEIGQFIDQPVRTYSTGMVLRLAFAVAAHVDPEILIVDEALAVGDISFRQRCMRRIHDLRARGTTLLFVSHETSDLKALCERCLWLQGGSVQDLGNTDEVVAKYLKSTLQRETSRAPEHFTDFTGHRYGDGRASIVSAALTPGERAVLKVSFRLNEPVSFPIVGFVLRNARGETIFGSNTAREDCPVPALAAGQITTINFHWTMPTLTPGSYHISLAITDGSLEDFKVCDYIENALTVEVAARETTAPGYIELRCAKVAISQP
jgi:lipopolysaccharide transport system ATP-binding protein